MCIPSAMLRRMDLVHLSLPVRAIIHLKTLCPASATKGGIRFVPIFEDDGAADSSIAENTLPGIPLVEFRNRAEIPGAMTQDSRIPAGPDNGSQGDPQDESFQG
jgi:hypothetical protein